MKNSVFYTSFWLMNSVISNLGSRNFEILPIFQVFLHSKLIALSEAVIIIRDLIYVLKYSNNLDQNIMITLHGW